MRVVLTADETLTSTYRYIPLLDFLGCAPVERLPASVYRILDTQIPDDNGKLTFAPYALRKIEAALLADQYRRDEVVVAHPRNVEQFIGEDTTIVGITAMDPLGLGPVTMMFTDAGKLTSYTKIKFTSLVRRLNDYRSRKGLKFKIVIGGPATWQLELRHETSRKMGIDNIVMGETDHVIGELFREIESDSADEVIHVKDWPSPEQIPTIVGPTYKGMVEVMRGCGRGCRFCSPNLRTARFLPIEKILDEVQVNLLAGERKAWLHSEDIFNYMLEDRKTFRPNEDAVIGLFREVMKKADYSNPTHGTVAGALAAPRILKEVAELDRANIHKWVGIQVGFETGSPDLIERFANNKMKPFSAAEWPWVILNGTYAFNKSFWFPAYTTIVGLPGETEEDEIDTARLILTMENKLKDKLGEKAHFTVTPLAFVPMGVLKGEEFFDMTSELTRARAIHIYYAWRHLAWEADHGLTTLAKGNPRLLMFLPLVRLGSTLIVKGMKRWASQHHFDLDKPLEPMQLKIDDIDV